MRITRLLAAAAVAAVVATAIPAAAHDHRPPRTQLRSGDTIQAGRQGSYCWTSAGEEPGTAETLCVDYISSFPRAKRVRSGAWASIHFKTPNEPTDTSLSYWGKVDENGFPVGNARSIDHGVVPVRRDDEIVAYRARFRLPQRRSHMYISAFGTWDDQDADAGPQDSTWTFHLRVR